MIKLTDLIVENTLREYSDEEKRKMKIPPEAVSRGGVWYVGDKYAGKVVKGKFVAAEPDDVGLRPGKTAASQHKMYKPGSSAAQAQVLRTGPNKGKLRRIRPRVSPLGNKLRNLPQDDLTPTAASGIWGVQGGDVKTEWLTKCGKKYNHQYNMEKC